MTADSINTQPLLTPLLPAQDEPQCTVCFDVIGKEQASKIPFQCRRHAFHNECIDPWLSDKTHACPNCRAPQIENRTNAVASRALVRVENQNISPAEVGRIPEIARREYELCLEISNNGKKILPLSSKAANWIVDCRIYKFLNNQCSIPGKAVALLIRIAALPIIIILAFIGFVYHICKLWDFTSLSNDCSTPSSFPCGHSLKRATKYTHFAKRHDRAALTDCENFFIRWIGFVFSSNVYKSDNTLENNVKPIRGPGQYIDLGYSSVEITQLPSIDRLRDLLAEEYIFDPSIATNENS